MGIKSKKQLDLPHNEKHAKNEHNNQAHNTSDTGLLSTVPAFDNTNREPKSGVAIPTDDAVQEIKAFMNINKQ